MDRADLSPLSGAQSASVRGRRRISATGTGIRTVWTMAVEKAPCSSETDSHIKPASQPRQRREYRTLPVKMRRFLLGGAEGFGKDKEEEEDMVEEASAFTFSSMGTRDDRVSRYYWASSSRHAFFAPRVHRPSLTGLGARTGIILRYPIEPGGFNCASRASRNWSTYWHFIPV